MSTIARDSKGNLVVIPNNLVEWLGERQNSAGEHYDIVTMLENCQKLIEKQAKDIALLRQDADRYNQLINTYIDAFNNKSRPWPTSTVTYTGPSITAIPVAKVAAKVKSDSLEQRLKVLEDRVAALEAWQ